MTRMSEDETLFEFPCEFPIKIMGKTGDDFELEVIQIIRRHVPDLTEGAIKKRASTKSNFTALTITITATSREQLDAIYYDLTASEQVLVAL